MRPPDLEPLLNVGVVGGLVENFLQPPAERSAKRVQRRAVRLEHLAGFSIIQKPLVKLLDDRRENLPGFPRQPAYRPDVRVAQTQPELWLKKIVKTKTLAT